MGGEGIVEGGDDAEYARLTLCGDQNVDAATAFTGAAISKGVVDLIQPSVAVIEQERREPTGKEPERVVM